MKKHLPFRFKKFSLHHQDNGMKIGTDGCLLGAWCPLSPHEHVLDVGSGTGLIAFMLAQRGNAINIIALEPSEKNYQELQRNITSNPEFGKRITPVKNTVQNFKTDKKFTGLVCNPPFYQEKLSAQNSNRDLARNIRHLPPEELFSAAHRLLSPTGWISVIIPHEIVQRYKHTAEENGFKLLQETQVKGRANKPVKRHLLQWAKEASSEHTKTDTLVLEMNPREKSHEFKQLLFPYLLD